ncbi:MAG: hypothetical protein NVSMB1_19530 [Polyangiales bacterium]
MLGCSSNVVGGEAEESESNAAAESLRSYDAGKAVRWADAHVFVGKSECAEFVSDCLHAGGLRGIGSTWAPTLDVQLQRYSSDHYTGTHTRVRACRGDVAVFYDAQGIAGHAGLVVENGDAYALGDFHNRSHYHLPLADILDGKYVSFRVYHLGC